MDCVLVAREIVRLGEDLNLRGTQNLTEARLVPQDLGDLLTLLATDRLIDLDRAC